MILIPQLVNGIVPEANNNVIKPPLIVPVVKNLVFDVKTFGETFATSDLVDLDGSNLAEKFIDNSGNGNDGIETIESRKPLYTINAINGHPGLDCSASGDVGFTLPSALHGVADNDNTVFYVGFTNSSASQQRFLVGHDSGGVQHWGFLYNRGASDAFSWVNASSFNQLRDSTTGGVTTPHLIRADRAGGTRRLSINGATPITDGLGSDSNDIVALDLGRRPNFQQGLIGFIGECLIYNRLLSAKEITLVEAYLSKKWDIALA